MRPIRIVVLPVMLTVVALGACGSPDAPAQSAPSSPATVVTVTATPTPTLTPTPTPTKPSPTQPEDPDRPDDALSVGETTVVDGIEVTLRKFQKVRAADALDGFRYYGAYMSFKNTTDGPKDVVADAQVRLENVYVATVNPLPSVEIKEGEGVPFGAFRPGTTVKGWVVWAVPESSDILNSFGIYYTDMVGNEVVWWNNIKP